MPQYLEDVGPKPEENKEEQTNFLTSAWNGNAPLWKVWWLIGIPINIAGAILEKLLLGLTEKYGSSGFLGITFALLMLALGLVWVKMAWACSGNVKNKIWTHLAKAGIVTGLIVGVASWFK